MKDMKRRTLSNSAFLKRVKDAIKQYDMLRKGDRVLVAVSGGADSVSLLKALLDIRKSLGIEIMAANMDHGLRGKESEKDSAFVKALAGSMGLVCAHKKVNCKTGGKKGISTEECAREKRYTFLREAAVKYDYNVIATGHTMDDQAETVLMRMIYGASSAGLSGIPPVRQDNGFRIIRPLIRTERKNVLGFLRQTGLEHVEDSTNTDMKFLRNRLRHEMLPYLEEYNPKIKRTLVNLADTLREDLGFLNEEKKKVLAKCPGGGDLVRIKIAEMILYPKTLRKEIFKELFRKSGGNIKKLTYRHWMDMDYFLKTAAKNKSLDMPGKVRVVKIGNDIVFEKRKYK